MFIKLVNVNTAEKLVAQAIFVIGVIVLVLGTYVTLNEADSKHSDNPIANVDPVFPAPHPSVMNKPEVVGQQIALPSIADGNDPKLPVSKRPPEDEIKTKDKIEQDKPKEGAEIRQEPIQPLPPKEDVIKKEESLPNVVTEASKKSTSEAKDDKVGDENIKQKEQDLAKREKQANKLIKELKEQKIEHQQILKEQKEVLEQMKEHVDAGKAQDTIIDGVQPQQAGGVNQAEIDQQPLQQIQQNIQQKGSHEPLQPAQIPVQQNQMLPQQNQPVQLSPVQQNQNIQNKGQGLLQQEPVLGNQANQIQIQQQQVIPEKPFQNNLQQNPIQPQQPIIQNQPLIQVPYVQQQQPIMQNQPINNQLPDHQISQNQNQAAQQHIIQNQVYQNVERQAQIANQPNQNPIPQQPVIQNEAIQIPQQQQIIQNQAVSNQAPQVQQQIIQSQFVQNPLEQRQQPVLPNVPLQNQVPQQQQQPFQQQLAQNPGLQQINKNPALYLNQSSQPVISNVHVKANIEKPGMQREQELNNRRFQGNDNELGQQNQLLQHQNSPSMQNTKLENKQQPGKEKIRQTFSKSYVENRGKVDVKRQTKASDIDKEGKLKAPGRDLKEAHIKHPATNYQYGDYNLKPKIVKREANAEERDEMLNPHSSRWQQYAKQNLNMLSMAGASMGILKTRHLLSDDNNKQ